MRNLKKILALVLALVMSMSLMATANAFTDDADVTPAYEEAVNVLAGIGVYKGYENADGTFTFNPKATITREEVAAIMYRIASGDVTDKQDDLYVEGADFTDVKATAWSAGYIGYCANGEIIVGNGDGTFGPKADVTGYQVLAMALRAVGYDKNGEFTGAEWYKNVATTAQALGILKNVPGTVQLSKPATRELVAELIFQTIANVKLVEYTNAFGYQPMQFYFGATSTLGYEQFKLTKVGYQDAFGRPGVQWFQDKNENKAYNSATEKLYATIMEDYIVAYNVATTECDIATAVGIKTSESYDMYVNGAANKSTYVVDAIATTVKVGAQGQIVEIYEDEIVIIDTYLAKVADVKAATFDAAGHLKTSSSLTLDVYTADNATTKNGVDETVVLYGGATNYTYAKGQMLLVNAVDAANGAIDTKVGTYGVTPSTLKIVGEPESITGTQTVLWYNVLQHTVNGTTYNDAVRFYMDEAGEDVGVHAWYFDQFGNLIGAADIATQYTYGTISNLWWAGDASTGSGVAKATITYMDATSETVNLAYVDVDGVTVYNNDGTVASGGTLGHKPVYSTDVLNVMGQIVAPSTTTYGTFGVSTNAYTNVASANNEVIGQHLFQFVTLADGSVAAYQVQKQVTPVTVTKGVSRIDTTDVYVDSETVFLVRSGAAGSYTYATVTGYNNIGTFTGATVDAAYTDADYAAEYVYLFGTAADGAADFVFSNGQNWNKTFKTLGGVNYFEFTYGIKADGTQNVIKVDPTKETEVITKMVNGVGKLYKLTYVNGLATAADEVTTAGTELGTNTAKFLGNKITANADVLYDNGVAIKNITSSTVVVGGTLADLATAGKGVYVVYPTLNDNYVTYIYITNMIPAQTQMDTAAAKAAALTIPAITGADVTEASIEAAVKAALVAAIGNSNITVQTDATYSPANDGVAANVTVWYSLWMTGATAVTNVTKTVSVTDYATSSAISTAIDAAVGSAASYAGYSNWNALKTWVLGAINGVSGVSDAAITYVPSDYAVGKVLAIPYTATYAGATISGTVVITIVA